MTKYIVLGMTGWAYRHSLIPTYGTLINKEETWCFILVTHIELKFCSFFHNYLSMKCPVLPLALLLLGHAFGPPISSV